MRRWKLGLRPAVAHGNVKSSCHSSKQRCFWEKIFNKFTCCFVKRVNCWSSTRWAAGTDKFFTGGGRSRIILPRLGLEGFSQWRLQGLQPLKLCSRFWEAGRSQEINVLSNKITDANSIPSKFFKFTFQKCRCNTIFTGIGIASGNSPVIVLIKATNLSYRYLYSPTYQCPWNMGSQNDSEGWGVGLIHWLFQLAV